MEWLSYRIRDEIKSHSETRPPWNVIRARTKNSPETPYLQKFYLVVQPMQLDASRKILVTQRDHERQTARAPADTISSSPDWFLGERSNHFFFSLQFCDESRESRAIGRDYFAATGPESDCSLASRISREGVCTRHHTTPDSNLY